MPVTIEWFDAERTITHMKFTEPWSISEMSEAIHQGRLMMQDVTHPVDVIFDTGAVQRIPPNIISHFIVSNDASYIPPNQRYVVVVVENRYLSAILGIAKRVLAAVTKKMLTAPSLDEAVALLYRRRAAELPAENTDGSGNA